MFPPRLIQILTGSYCVKSPCRLGVLLLLLVTVSPTINLSAQTRGATFPYIRFEAETLAAEAGVIPAKGGTAFLGPTFTVNTPGIEASNRKCALLKNSSDFISWQVPSIPSNKNYRGFNLRFSVPDGNNGAGSNAQLRLEVKNGSGIWTTSRTFTVNSKWAYQYFKPLKSIGVCGDTSTARVSLQCGEVVDTTLPMFSDPYNCTSGGFRYKHMWFDEIHFLLNDALTSGKEFRLVKADTTTSNYYIDFVELEEVDAPVTSLLNFSTFALNPNETPEQRTKRLTDSLNKNGNVNLLFQPGTYIFKRPHPDSSGWIKIINLNGKKTLRGAGIWYTTLHFSSENDNSVENEANFENGGFFNAGAQLDFSDFSMNSDLTIRTRRYSGFFGSQGSNGRIHDIWIDHFSTGMWVSKVGGSLLPTDGLIVSNMRIRNTYADGINLNSEVKNSLVTNCSFRNNGDDAMAFGPAETGSFLSNRNKFTFCTAENGMRAAGLAMVAGQLHEASFLKIKECQGGMRFCSVNDGRGFDTTGGGVTKVNDVDVIGCGSQYGVFTEPRGAIDFVVGDVSDVTNLRFSNIDIKNSPGDALYFSSQPIRTKVIGVPCKDSLTYNKIRNTNFTGINVNGINAGSWPGLGYLMRAEKNVYGEIAFDGLTVTNVSNQRILSSLSPGFLIKTNVVNGYSASLPQTINADGFSFKYNETRVVANQGQGILTDEDDIQYVHTVKYADFTLTAKIPFAEMEASSGIMIRKTTGPGSPFISVSLLKSGSSYALKVNRRYMANTTSAEVFDSTLDGSKIYELKIVRLNTSYVVSYRLENGAWRTVASQTISALNGSVTAGTFVTSNDTGTVRYGLFNEIVVDSSGTAVVLSKRNLNSPVSQNNAASVYTVIYPNPLIGTQLNIVNKNLNGKVNMQIVNSSGQLVKTASVIASNGQLILSLVDLSPGTYIIQLAQKGSLTQFKFLVPNR